MIVLVAKKMNATTSLSYEQVEQYSFLNDQFAVEHIETVYQTYNYSVLRGLQREGKTRSKKGMDNAGQLAEGDKRDYHGPDVSVLLEDEGEVEKVPLEQYVLGVALAELPLSFELEAIKAQMLAIRTYIVHRMQNEDNLVENKQSGEMYWVTNSQNYQVYRSVREVAQLRNNTYYTEQIEKFDQALRDTEDNILVYQEQPIQAVFFSTSNGYTEDAEQYWGNDIAYLQSVDSKWDKDISPSYEQSITYTYEQFYERLGLQEEKDAMIKISQVSYTDSQRISSLQINGQLFQGKEIREKLELASTHFAWQIDKTKQKIQFTTYGYGHGVGMSQWGANGMAQDGYLAEDIVKHYYQGIDIKQASKLAKNY